MQRPQTTRPHPPFLVPSRAPPAATMDGITTTEDPAIALACAVRAARGPFPADILTLARGLPTVLPRLSPLQAATLFSVLLERAAAVPAATVDALTGAAAAMARAAALDDGAGAAMARALGDAYAAEGPRPATLAAIGDTLREPASGHPRQQLGTYHQQRTDGCTDIGFCLSFSALPIHRKSVQSKHQSLRPPAYVTPRTRMWPLLTDGNPR